MAQINLPLAAAPPPAHPSPSFPALGRIKCAGANNPLDTAPELPAEGNLNSPGDHHIYWAPPTSDVNPPERSAAAHASRQPSPESVPAISTFQLSARHMATPAVPQHLFQNPSLQRADYLEGSSLARPIPRQTFWHELLARAASVKHDMTWLPMARNDSLRTTPSLPKRSSAFRFGPEPSPPSHCQFEKHTILAEVSGSSSRYTSRR